MCQQREGMRKARDIGYVLAGRLAKRILIPRSFILNTVIAHQMGMNGPASDGCFWGRVPAPGGKYKGKDEVRADHPQTAQQSNAHRCHQSCAWISRVLGKSWLPLLD